MRNYILIFLFHLSFYSFSQNYIYKGQERYLATPSWTYSVNNEFRSYIDLQVAKKNHGGYLMISYYESNFYGFPNFDIYLYLEDGSVIKCLNRNINDYVDKKIFKMFQLTSTEIDKLKISRIKTVRFGNKTAENYDYVKSLISNTNYSETEKDIYKLFEN
ncbi:hypothetical protein EB1_34600 [Empedobacter brevis NBRC 14943 = ATCC 43319]|uniref:Uncharacterized protein n=1 Tax=Empedobacter brevis NBRC 14943 = ATCC 43319 TaxID=1218108 RepID=A0A511NLK3_9FLAO|nr:hypothetical protein [Empedobacter brevis]GEM53670.1 hypothetical protein EB1_34600 [Empedobacter brevis NBRC 14943 = ATCC 43319]